MNHILDVLCHCPIFAGKEKPEIANTLAQIKYKLCHFAKSEYIFRTDQPSLYIGIIIKGSVEVQKVFASGKVVSIVYRNKGGIFGGAIAFAQNSAYFCDVLANESSEILLLHKQVVLDLLYRNKTIANILDLAADNILQLNRRIELLSYSSIKQKIAFFLLYDANASDHDKIHLPYSKKAWAEYLNVSRPSLCRELKNLSDAGMVTIQDRTIKIIHKEKLKTILIN